MSEKETTTYEVIMSNGFHRWRAVGGCDAVCGEVHGMYAKNHPVGTKLTVTIECPPAAVQITEKDLLRVAAATNDEETGGRVADAYRALREKVTVALEALDKAGCPIYEAKRVLAAALEGK